MIMAAAKTLASLSPASVIPDAPLLPPIADSRKTGLAVGEAVARQAIADGVAEAMDDVRANLEAYVWEPIYRPYVRVESGS
jgi:malate dehydrogenase (oxaloacetate-decarboxylating)